ncbi:MAG: DUF4157 domain-containing protein [Mycobacterium sp.]
MSHSAGCHESVRASRDASLVATPADAVSRSASAATTGLAAPGLAPSRISAGTPFPRPALAWRKTLARPSQIPASSPGKDGGGPRYTSPVLDVVGKGGGQPLDPMVRADMEVRLGSDFSAVRIHTDEEAARSAAAVSASAYTVGNEVVFGESYFDPASPAGRHRLAHELVHVQQQRKGPVSGVDAGGGVAISDPSDSFEQEAEATASSILSDPTSAVAGPGPSTGVVQRSCGAGCGCESCQATTDDGEAGSPAATFPLVALQRVTTCDPSVASCPAGTVDPDGNPNPGTDPNAGPNQSVDPNAGPNQSVDPNAGPNHSVDPNAGPNQSVDPNAAPNAGVSIPSSGGHIYFDHDQAVLRPDAISAIDTYAAQYLASSQDTDINVMGWASVEGPNDHNNDLSISRATAVKNELVAQGVSDAHISVGAGGATSQFSRDLEPNRRVEITPPQSGRSSQPKCPLPSLPTITIASITSKLSYNGTASVDYRVEGVGTGPGVVFYPKVETGGDRIVVPSAPYLPDEMRADNAMGTFGVQGVATGNTQIAMSVTDPCNATAVSNYILFSVDISAARRTNFTLTPVKGMDGGEIFGGGVIVYELKEDWPGGRTANLSFTGVGLTGGSPITITGPGSSSSFTTPTPQRIEDFEGAPGRITSAAVAVGVGGGYAVLTFPNGVQVQGFGVGAGVAAGASVYVGGWKREDN